MSDEQQTERVGVLEQERRRQAEMTEAERRADLANVRRLAERAKA